jgi:acyl-CoA thioester hydrolase
VIERYPLVTEIVPRYGDLDPLRHLNNVAQAGYYEEGVMALHRRALDGIEREAGHGVVFQVTLRFLAEGSYPQPLALGGGVKRIGTTSYTFEQALFQEGRQVSVCETVVVYTQGGKAAPVPEQYRVGLGTLLISDEA